jgi:hypothetical protein
MLGHKSTKVTEKHYIHWVPALQDKLEDDMRAGIAAQKKQVKAQLKAMAVHSRR